MPHYQKAYPLKELRQFPGWNEQNYVSAESTRRGHSPDEPLTDESIVFVHEDLVVTANCWDDSQVIMNDLSPEWEAFCRNVLKLEVPDWENESRQVRESVRTDDR